MNDLFGPVVIRDTTRSIHHKPEERICQECNQKYITVHGAQKYCNGDCKRQVALRRMREYVKKNRNIGPKEIVCKMCGKSFITKLKRGGNEKYCSYECVGRSARKHRIIAIAAE
jgi:tRNA U38,U39,U40 pseudouridine synthase TruA